MTTVSVIVPVYNSEKYLRQCLDSLVAQDFPDLELILVDDGSTDTSFSILKEYQEKDQRIRIFHKENEGKGAASARNLGLKESKGEYIQFVDSDDFFEQNMVSRLYNKAKESGADIVICAADRYDETKGKITRDYSSIDLGLAPHKEVFSKEDIPEKLYQMADTITWNKLYRRELLEKHNLKYESIPISDDQYVPALGLAFADKLAIVDEKLVHYRFNTGSSQVDTYAKHPKSAYLAAYSIISRMKDAGVYELLKRSYLNTAIRLLRDYYDKISDYEQFIKQHETYLSEVLPRFEAEGLPAGFFYDAKLDSWYQMITHESPGEILFRVARAYSEDTTRILREGV